MQLQSNNRVKFIQYQVDPYTFRVIECPTGKPNLMLKIIRPTPTPTSAAFSEKQYDRDNTGSLPQPSSKSQYQIDMSPRLCNLLG